ncbi:18758_t:CDS:2 [Funneliformis geosporum]|uniref:Man(5)GlcNAc(2)-PP-dolichol translocation protein RFT1 n=1 Tax=Funneliformis geosporum TaxID=1117311 RepID=A0A9W4SIE1_9GLOM|nr:18758_t:CDS:2 [Funneliformis geosporum]
MSTIKSRNVEENSNENKSQSDSQEDVSKILSSSVAGASSLVILQLISRLATFVLHQIVLRYTDPATFGIASVQLELLLATILFLSREGFRCALLRGCGDISKVDHDENSQGKSKDSIIFANSPVGSIQKITNLSYVPIPIGIITTFLACVFYIFYANEESLATPYYVSSVVLYGLAAFGELIIEPLYIATMNNLIFILRVRCEMIGVVVRCVITLTMTLMGIPKNNEKGKNAYGILAFAVAQFAFMSVLLLGYVGYFISNWDIQLLKPRKLIDERQRVFWFDEHLFGLAKTFTKQSLLKHVLTEGSLIVRILFQPLEETGRTLFSKLLTSVDNPNVIDDNVEKRESKAAARKIALTTSLQVLIIMMKFHLLLGLLFIGLATNYTGTLIDLLVGPVWSKSLAPFALSFYCIYVPIMGINGITEAFVVAVATEETLSALNYWLITFSAGFVGTGIIFMKGLSAGAVGLIAANMFNLSTRILWSWNYIKSYYLKNRGGNKQEIDELKRMLAISNILPKPLVLISFSLVWIITYFSNQFIGWETLNAKIIHIAVGGVCAIFVAGIT